MLNVSRTLLIVCVLTLTGCSSLISGERKAPEIFILEPPISGIQRVAANHGEKVPCGRIQIDIPTSAPGYGSSAMLYMRGGYQLQGFAYHEWADVPARMLEPLLRHALESTGLFSAVLQSPTSASVDFRLETNSVLLRQLFPPQGRSSVQLSLQARLFAHHKLIGVREFFIDEPAEQSTPIAGVDAANRATAIFLRKISQWIQQRLFGAGECGRGRP